MVRALRSADHDVVAIAEVSPREEDPSVMDRAVKDSRILITEDKVRSTSLREDAKYRRCHFYSFSGPCKTESSRRSCGIGATAWGKSHRKFYRPSTRARAYRSKAEEVNIWILGIFGRDRRRCLRWLFEARNGYVSRFLITVSSGVAH